MGEKADKERRLLALLRDILLAEGKALVFLGTKQRADQLCKLLRGNGYPALAIHGDKTQEERDWVFSQFSTGKSPIMLATDVASRGIHVDDITHVINYDFPKTMEDYVHRVGRTGRAGNKGTAHTFFEPVDKRRAPKLMEVLEAAKQKVPKKLKKLAKGQTSKRWKPY